MDKRPETTAWVLCIALIALALFSAARESFDAEENVESTRRAVDLLHSEWSDGDGVVVLPGWDDGLYADLVSATAETGPSLGGLIRGERIDPVRLFTHKRLWVLSRYGAVSALPSVLTSDIESVSQRHAEDGVTLSLFELVDARPVAQLTDHVSELTVERRLDDGETRACPWRIGQHRCGLASWLDVRVTTHNVNHRDVNWLFAHAGPDDATLVITWSDVPRTEALILRAGFTQSSTRHQPGSPTLVRTYVDDIAQDEVWLAPHRYGQATQVISPPSGGELMTVRIEVSAASSSWRQVMLQANLFDALPATLQQADGPP